MKIALPESNVERFGTSTEKNFSIKATGKAFKILSSGLYKDKITAILREIGCNAFDAHRAAGCSDKPFSIHLPNGIEPYLSIRDYGKGLSVEDVTDLYSTYFESTKAESNDYIGAMGLGSKSPFSYVKSFTVVSRHQGVKVTYDAYVDADGMPSIAQRGDPVLSSEPSGLEVIVPVTTAQDCREFATKARDVYALFKPLPLVTGSHGFTFNVPKTVLEGEDYRITNAAHGARAIMGVVAYPIDSHTLLTGEAATNEIDAWGRPARRNYNAEDQKIAELLACPVDIDFPIGDLDVTAGREELSYDKTTIANLRERITGVQKSLLKRVEETFAECPTEYAARMKYGEMFEAYNTPTMVRALGKTPKITYRGAKIDSSRFSFDLKNFPNTTVYNFAGSHRRSLGSHTTQRYEPNEKPLYSWQTSSNVIYIETAKAANKPIIVDEPRAFVKRIAEFRSTLPYGNKDVVAINCTDDEELTRLKTFLDGVTYTFTSTLERPRSVKKDKARLKRIVSARINDDHIKCPANSDHPWEEVEVELDTGGIYVLTRHNRFFVEEEDYNDKFSDVFTQARELKLYDPAAKPVFAIPQTMSKKFKESDDWSEFFELIRQSLKDAITSELESNISRLRHRIFFVENNREVAAAARRFFNVVNDLPKGMFRNFIEEYRRQDVLPQNLDKYNELALHLDVTINVPTGEQYNLTAQWNRIKTEYPLLRPAFTSRDIRTETRDIVQYIKLMDALRAAQNMEQN